MAQTLARSAMALARPSTCCACVRCGLSSILPSRPTVPVPARERRDHAPRVLDLLARAERRVDPATWSGWIAILPVKPARRDARTSRFRRSWSRKSGVIVSIACTPAAVRAEQAQRARELVGELVLAAVDAIGAGADRRRQILGAPRERRAGAARRRDSVSSANIACGVSVATGDDANRPRGDAVALLERRQVVVEHDDLAAPTRPSAARCRPGAPPHDRDEVGQRQRRRQRVDAHPQLLARRGRVALARYSLHHAARDVDALDRHRVLEVEDQRARPRVDCALAIFLSLSPGTNRRDRRIMMQASCS